MRMNRLGQSGLIVSELCLGTMTFGSSDGIAAAIAGLDQMQSTTLVRQALDAGINFIDTADIYSEGRSEQVLGQALRDLGVNRSDVVIATKAMVPMGPGSNDGGNSRYHLMHAIDASLSRLGLDHVDLFQLHGWDVHTPLEETLRALDDIVRSGRVRYVGVSNFAAWQVAKAQGMAERLGLSRIASQQSYYTIAGRDLEREIVPMLQSEGVGLMVWSPLAGGLLSGKYTRQGQSTSAGEGRRAAFDFPPVVPDHAWDVIDAMKDLAAAKGCTVAQVAIAWLLYQPVVSSVIVGAKRPDQLADNIGAVDVALTADDLARLDSVSALPAEYPGWMFALQATFRAQAVSPRRIPG